MIALQDMIAFFSDLSLWDWADLIGLLLVFIGVVGEILAHKKHNEAVESIFGYILIAGLTLELLALPHHFIEASKLQGVAATANRIASSNAVVVVEHQKQLEVLRGENLKLTRKTQPRLITDPLVIESLRKCLREGPKGGFGIITAFTDPESRSFADQLSSILQSEGFTAVGFENTGVTLAIDPPGISVGWDFFAGESKHGSAIINCLQLNGFETRLSYKFPKGLKAGDVFIYIGPRF